MKTTLFFLLIVVFSATVFPQSTAQKKRSEAEIRAVLTRQAAAWNAGDIEGFMLGYWNSPNLVFVSGDNITRGWKSTLERYKRTYDSREKMGTLAFSELEINVISATAATVLGAWSLERAGDNPHGKFTLVLRKFKSGWRVVHDHTS